MDRDCRHAQANLVGLALGEVNADTAAHVEGCARCAAKLAQFRQVIAAFAKPLFQASNELIVAAQALGAPVPAGGSSQSLWRFLQPSAAFRGVTATERHAWIAAPGVDLRLMASQELNGFRILGHASGNVDSVRSGGAAINLSDGRFELFVNEVDDAAIEVVVDGQVLPCPPMSAVFGDGRIDSV